MAIRKKQKKESILPVNPVNPVDSVNKKFYKCMVISLLENEYADSTGITEITGSEEGPIASKLPPFLQEIAKVAKNEQEAQLLVLLTLVTLSVCFPKVSGVYVKKRYWSNLYLMVVGPAASGKAKMDLCRNLVYPIHKELLLFNRKIIQFIDTCLF